MALQRVPGRHIETVKDADVNAQRVQTGLDAVMSNALVNGERFTLALTVGVPTTFVHGLTAEPTGFFVVDKTTHGSVRRVSWTKRQMTVESNITGTYVLLVV